VTNRRVPRVYPVCQVLDIYDGDTIRVDTDRGGHVHTHDWLRLKGVRAPELREPDGPAARGDVIAWMNEHAPDGFVEVTTFWTQGDLKEINEEMTFVRYVAEVRAGGVELNQWLAAKGWIDRGMST
jgi:endonuclease YncB( thermonuclease family)